MSLPHELTHDQRRELLHSFAKERYVSKGMIADISYHEPGKGGDDRNYHAHILLTLRPLNDNGEFANKNREWNHKQNLFQDREAWAEYLNRALERVGSQDRVDSRSFEERGLDQKPTKHLGPDATEMERRGEPTRIGDENRDAEHWNRELAEIEAQEKIIDLAIEREKRRIAAEQKHKAALARKDRGETLREKAKSFEDEAALLAQRHNALYLKQLDERRTLEADIARRRAELDRTNKEFYDLQGTQEALKKAQNDLRNAQTLAGRLSGKEREAQERIDALRLNLADIERRQAEREGFLKRQTDEQLEALKQRQQDETKHLHGPPEPERDAESEDMRQHRPSIRVPSSRAVNDHTPLSPAPRDWRAYSLSRTFDETASTQHAATEAHPEFQEGPSPPDPSISPHDEPDQGPSPPPERDRGPSMDR